MRPTARAFVAGIVACIVLLAILHTVGFVDLGALLPTGAVKRLVFALVLQPPTFPGENDPSDQGRADYDWTLVSLSGEPVSFSTFRGRTVFMNVWATWCAPCVMEMPYIERLHRSLEGSQIAFVVVSQEDVENPRSSRI
jgi:thiol-disulfide isomerase/thioredoxin